MEFIQIQKKQFLEREVMMSVFQASLSRGLRYRVYKANALDTEKIMFREDVARYLREQLKRYQANGKEESKRHILNIIELQEYISTKWKNILHEHGTHKGCITFGRAQKLLNLYLKWCWVLDWINTPPPHPPIDSIVLGKVQWNGYSWQDPRFNEETYRNAIKQCADVANGQELALWELSIFNEEREEKPVALSNN